MAKPELKRPDPNRFCKVTMGFLVRNDITDEEKLLLIYLSIHVNHEAHWDGRVWPMDETIARDLSWNVRKLQRVLLGLETKHLIARRRRRSHGRMLFVTWTEQEWVDAQTASLSSRTT